MNPILPEQSAREECLKLIEELDSSPLGEALMKEGHGRMFGILVCTDGTVLRSFSGELEGELSAEGFVPPLFDIAKYRAILYSYDRLIKSSQDHRSLSRECWKELQALYHFTCFDGSVLKLSSVLELSHQVQATVAPQGFSATPTAIIRDRPLSASSSTEAAQWSTRAFTTPVTQGAGLFCLTS